MRKYRRVTYLDRCHISSYLEIKLSLSEIARRTGFHKSTISREYRRHLYRGSYCVKVAQESSERSFRRCRRKKKIYQRLKRELVAYLEKGWSPEQISGRFKLEGYIDISKQTIYRSLVAGNRERKLLRRFGRRGAGRKRQRELKMEGKRSIHERSKIVSQRRRFGDWERDGMYGSDRKQLLVLTERKSRLLKLGYMGTGKSSEVESLTRSLLKSTGRKVYTLTNDNGTEFSKGPKSSYAVYYCDPLKPQQRGTVENTIGLLRQYVKRKTDVSQYERKDLRALENKLNFRPRKCLNYKTPHEVFYNKAVALVL